MVAKQYIKMSQAVEGFVALRRATVSPVTAKNEAFIIRRFAAYLGEDIQLRHLRRDHVTEWFYGPQGVMSEHRTRDGRTRPGIHASTHNHYRTRLQAFFLYCQRRGYIQDDLLLDVPIKKFVRRQRFQPQPDLLLALLEQARDARDRMYLAIAINTALRQGDIRSIRVGDVDLAGGWLKVIIAKTSEADAKPISTELDAELRAWFVIYADAIGRPLRGDDYLIPARVGSKYVWRTLPDGSREKGRTEATWNPLAPVTKTALIVKHSMEGLGLPTQHEGTHTIRRAVARAFFDQLVETVGYDGALRTTSAVLNHKNATTTEMYLGLSSERKRRDDLMRGKPFLSAMVDKSNVHHLRGLGS